jgi:hypothetical protein
MSLGVCSFVKYVVLVHGSWVTDYIFVDKLETKDF